MPNCFARFHVDTHTHTIHYCMTDFEFKIAFAMVLDIIGFFFHSNMFKKGEGNPKLTSIQQWKWIYPFEKKRYISFFRFQSNHCRSFPKSIVTFPLRKASLLICFASCAICAREKNQQIIFHYKNYFINENNANYPKKREKKQTNIILHRNNW